MSIVPLKKITLAGSSRQQSAIIRGLQHFGKLHIIDKAHPKLPDEADISPKDQRASDALLYLQRSRIKRRAVTHAVEFDFDQVVNEALALRQRQAELEDQLTSLRQRIARVKPWGDFSFPPHAYVDYFRLWFYCLPVNRRHALKKVNLPWQIVGRSNTLLHLVVISADEPPADLLPVAREHLGSKTLQQLRDDEEALDVQLDEVQARREELTHYLFIMEKHLVRANNHAYFSYVMQQAASQGDFFTLQAWLPAHELPALEALRAELSFGYLAEDPAVDELPPTLLAPVKGFGPGARLAAIYQLPAYRGWDPSVHLYLWFALFFAMVMSDAGYAVALAGVLGIYWRKLGRSEVGYELRYLMRFMLLVATGWGVLVGSYFGYSPPPEGVLAGLQQFDINHYDSMMKLSVLAGVLHIVVGNVAQAWHQGWALAPTLTRLGWIAVAVSGYGLWLLAGMSEPQPVWQQTAQIGLVAGGTLVLLFSSSKPLTSWKSAGLHLLGGVLALTNLTKLFGDVLSYMRLFALGLASASLAITFNQLAESAYAAGGLGMVGGFLIFLIGHLVNLVLGIMSGVVHGLRLNFIEFYNWAEPGEGYEFTPFTHKEIVYE